MPNAVLIFFCILYAAMVLFVWFAVFFLLSRLLLYYLLVRLPVSLFLHIVVVCENIVIRLRLFHISFDVGENIYKQDLLLYRVQRYNIRSYDNAHGCYHVLFLLNIFFVFRFLAFLLNKKRIQNIIQIGRHIHTHCTRITYIQHKAYSFIHEATPLTIKQECEHIQRRRRENS